MGKNILSWEDFLEIPAREVFAKGIARDDVDGLNMLGTGNPLYWVAVKGRIDDWAIYCSWSSNELFIRDHGEKVHDRKGIQNVINVDERVLARYRD